MLKLMIVDDEKIIRETMATIIDWNALNIRLVGIAKDGIEAYNLFLDEYPELILTDIKMPALSGLELIQKIREINSNTQFIILSGYGEFEYAKQAMNYGVKYYLLKPCNEEQIITNIKSAIKDYTLLNQRNNSSNFININCTVMCNIINLYLMSEENKILLNTDTSYVDQYHFFDFYYTPYHIFYLYYVLPEYYSNIMDKIKLFQKEHYSNSIFYMIYVRNTLIIYFIAENNDEHLLYDFLSNLTTKQTIEIELKYDFYPNLKELLSELIPRLKRYEMIYYSSNTLSLSISNYQNIIRDVQLLVELLYTDLKENAPVHYQSIMDILYTISDTELLKQLISSILVYSSTKYDFSHKVMNTMLAINEKENTDDILLLIETELSQLYKTFYQNKKQNSISQKIEDYVLEHLTNENLSLKWIGENYLFMNVDYLSRKFHQETGYKFSAYLNELRIQKAKQLLNQNPNSKIQEIADQIGYGNNPQYLSQIFKKYTGMTIGQYVKQMTS